MYAARVAALASALMLCTSQSPFKQVRFRRGSEAVVPFESRATQTRIFARLLSMCPHFRAPQVSSDALSFYDDFTNNFGAVLAARARLRLRAPRLIAGVSSPRRAVGCVAAGGPCTAPPHPRLASLPAAGTPQAPRTRCSSATATSYSSTWITCGSWCATSALAGRRPASARFCRPPWRARWPTARRRASRRRRALPSITQLRHRAASHCRAP